MKPLSVYWWRSPDFVNIGDEINPMICQYASGRPFQHGSLAECDFLAIGSVLHFPINQKVFQTRTAPIHVWGSGTMEPKPVPPEAPFVFHALRGHLTLCLTSAPQGLPLVWPHAPGAAAARLAALWQEPWFRPPDLALLSGPETAAVMAELAARTPGPVRVLAGGMTEYRLDPKSSIQNGLNHIRLLRGSVLGGECEL